MLVPVRMMAIASKMIFVELLSKNGLTVEAPVATITKFPYCFGMSISEVYCYYINFIFTIS